MRLREEVRGSWTGMRVRGSCSLPSTSGFGLTSRCSALVLGVLLVVSCLSSCVRSQFISTNSQEPSLDGEAARTLANSLADNLVHDHRSEIRASLENAFREAIDEKEFNALLDRMIDAYGKPLDFELKRSEQGTKQYVGSQTKPMRKFWYAASTSKYKKGSHFLIVEIVSDGNRLAVSSFAIVNFSAEIPSDLK